MLKWFKILLLTVCFAFSCQAFTAIESSSDKLLDSEKHGVVYDHQQKPQTALSESLNFVRLCSSMSERVLPSSNFTQTLRTSVRTHYLFSTQKNAFMRILCAHAKASSLLAHLTKSQLFI